MTPIVVGTMDGDLEGALGAAETVVARAEEMGRDLSGKQQAYRNAMRPLLLLGQAAEALEKLRMLRDLAGRDFPGTGLCLAHLGRHEEARAQLAEEYGEHASDGEGPDAPTQALIVLLETAVLLGDTEAAGHIARRLEPVSHLIFAGADGTCVARHLGAAAALLGDRIGARARYAQALEVAERVRHRPEVALTRLAIAELLLDEARAPTPTPPPILRQAQDRPLVEGQGVRAEALAHLDFAIEEFRAMKMQPSLERALRHKGLLHA